MIWEVKRQTSSQLSVQVPEACWNGGTEWNLGRNSQSFLRAVSREAFSAIEPTMLCRIPISGERIVLRKPSRLPESNNGKTPCSARSCWEGAGSRKNQHMLYSGPLTPIPGVHIASQQRQMFKELGVYFCFLIASSQDWIWIHERINWKWVQYCKTLKVLLERWKGW